MIRAAVLALVLAACRGSSAKVHRTGSAAPVEMIAQPAPADAGTGSATEEVEPNDTADVATPLPLGGKIRGKIEPETDVDRYRIDVPKAGALQVAIAPVDMDLVLEIEDASGTVLARSARGGGRVVEGVPNLGVQPGRYTAVVRAAAKKKPQVPRHGHRPGPEPAKPAPVYELTAQLVQPPAGAEHEPDDDRGTANDLLPGDTATGYVGWSGDQDFWKLSVEALAARNTLAFELSPVEGVALELELQDALGQSLLVRKGARGDGATVSSFVPTIAQGAPPFVYVVVRGDRSNPETAYQLHVTPGVPGPDDELEPDDTPDHAFAIPPDRQVVHAIWEYGDTDCFAVPVAAQARGIELSFDTPSELDLAAELFIDGKSVAKVDHPGKGVQEKVGAPVAAGSHAVACVHAAGEGPGKKRIAYDVHVSESGAAGDDAP